MLNFCQYQRFLNILFGDVSVAQLVASMSGVVLGGVVEVVGSNLTRGKKFTASIGSVDSLYPSVFIYCLNLHQFLVLCSSKAMMFVILYFRTSDIYIYIYIYILGQKRNTAYKTYIVYGGSFTNLSQAICHSLSADSWIMSSWGCSCYHCHWTKLIHQFKPTF